MKICTRQEKDQKSMKIATLLSVSSFIDILFNPFGKGSKKNKKVESSTGDQQGSFSIFLFYFFCSKWPKNHFRN